MDKRNIYYFIIASFLIIGTINCAYAGTKTADTASINKRIKFALKNIYSFRIVLNNSIYWPLKKLITITLVI